MTRVCRCGHDEAFHEPNCRARIQGEHGPLDWYLCRCLAFDEYHGEDC